MRNLPAGPAPRVLFLTSSAGRYGSDRGMAELTPRLADLGCRVAVVVPNAGPLADELAARGIPMSVIPLSVVERSLAPRALAGLSKSLARPSRVLVDAGREFRPDIVYSNTSHVLDGPALARALGARHVWHLREIERVPALARRAYGRFLLTTGDRVMAISEAVRAAYYTRPHTKAMVILDGVDVNAYRRAAPYRAPQAFTPSRPLRLLSIGRLTPWKGQHVVATAVSQLSSEGIPVSLRIRGEALTMGDHSYGDTLRRIAGASKGAVEIHPEVDDVGREYEWADIVVHTSVEPEPFGRVVVEAMAAGRLIIASALGGPLETVDRDHDGYLVPPNDASALAELLRALASDPALIERRASACRQRANMFSVEATARRIWDQLTAVNARRQPQLDGVL